ncbi:MAG: protoporphyrinogen oxidase [Legionellaceae bacterium]|nr:protoporphyrinogen oxidase [Legionellaceae bacterium]HAF87437.1 protoporphyrinogen oxidase [Legionellales bacterium]HCA89704.1 protoporphyrinogen oxidase [Legionellales bacterium]|tara:strand:+ start:3646 stop:4818 length:1173 start_codon:yes stop_codon:yes gene_type:complete
MIKWLSALAVLILATYLGLHLTRDPGYVLIIFHHWSIQTTLLVAIVAFLIILIAIKVLFKTIFFSLNIPSIYRKWRQKKGKRQQQAAGKQSLIELHEGYYLLAKQGALPSITKTSPLLNYFVAAKAAHALKEYDTRDNYLTCALKAHPKAQAAILLNHLTLQLDSAQWQDGKMTLDKLHVLAPNHPYALHLSIKLYQALGEWSHLITILPEVRRHQLLTHIDFDTLEYEVYLQALLDLIRLKQPSDIHQFFKTMPKKIQRAPDIIHHLAEYFMMHQQFDKAENLLHQALKKQEHSHLLMLYSNLPAEAAQLSFIESLLPKHTPTAELYFCLGQLSLKQQLWGKARHYLEKSLKIKPTSLAYLSLGKLQEQNHEPDNALATYKMGLEQLLT